MNPSDVLGVTFGGFHTWADWGLYLTGPASISLPVPQTNYIEVPGRDGYLDLSTALTGEPVYQTRDFSVPLMSLASPEAWPGLYSSILNAIHGQTLEIVLDEDPDYYYTGRVSVELPSYDGTWQFVVSGVLYPYKLKQTDTVVTAALTDTDTVLTLTNQRRPVVPVITVDAETLLTWNGGTCTVSPGAHSLTALRLTAGSHTLKARTVSGAGTITITYREGSL